MKPILAAAALAIALFHAQAASGQEAADSTPRYSVPEVTVTATRGSVDREQVPQRIDVVTPEAVAATPAADLGETLRANVAVDVISYPALLTGISIRGFRPEYSGINPRTLLLFDGRPAGTTNIALFDPASIERIEVLRGPASALYGFSAMGGVVNLIPFRSVRGLSSRWSGSYGTFGDYRARLHAGGALGERVDFDLSLSSVGRNGGYSTGDRRTFGADSLVKTLPDGTRTLLGPVGRDAEVDFAHYAAQSGALRFGYAVTPAWRVDVRGEGTVSDGVENPGDLTPQDWDSRSLKDLSRGSLDARISGDVGSHAPSLRAYLTRETIGYYNGPEAPNFINFRTPIETRGFQLQDALDRDRYGFTAGVDYHAADSRSEAFTAENVAGAPYSPDSSIRSLAAFLQARGSLADRLLLSAGVRLDRTEFAVLETPKLDGYPAGTEQHSVVSPNMGARFILAPGIQLRGNVGRAFVAPDAFRIAGYSEIRAGTDRDAVQVTRGNPDLDPERSTTWDAALSLFRPAAGIDIEVGYFHTDVSDRIATEFVPGSGSERTPAGDTILSTTTWVNVDRAALNGLEGRATWEIGGLLGMRESLRLFANGTRILDATESFDATGEERRIRNVADLTVVGGVAYDDGRLLSGRLGGRYVGERVDADYVAWWEPGEIEYPAYLVFDASASVRIGGRYRLGAEIRNLTNEDHFEVRGYNMPGRSAALTLAIDF